MGKRLRVAMFALVGLVCAGCAAHAQARQNHSQVLMKTVHVPFVGCKADGQVGPVAAPHGASKAVRIPAEEARGLAWYQAKYGVGVLAPRGWYCFETYGASGSNLFVSPKPIDKSRFFAEETRSFLGNAIELAQVDGGTSGRFEVAKVIARVFPAYTSSLKSVIAEKIEPASDFPRRPYPTDKLTYVGKNIVQFTTPANTKGLGTDSWLVENNRPIRGIAILVPVIPAAEGTTPSLLQLSMRLPPKLKGLENAIILGVREEAVQDKE